MTVLASPDDTLPPPPAHDTIPSPPRSDGGDRYLTMIDFMRDEARYEPNEIEYIDRDND